MSLNPDQFKARVLQPLKTPRLCVCCGGAPVGDITVKATRSSAGELGCTALVLAATAFMGTAVVAGTHSEYSWEFPACSRCRRHLFGVRASAFAAIASAIPAFLVTGGLFVKGAGDTSGLDLGHRGEALLLAFLCAAGAMLAVAAVYQGGRLLLGSVTPPCTAPEPVGCETDGNSVVFTFSNAAFLSKLKTLNPATRADSAESTKAPEARHQRRPPEAAKKAPSPAVEPEPTDGIPAHPPPSYSEDWPEDTELALIKLPLSEPTQRQLQGYADATGVSPYEARMHLNRPLPTLLKAELRPALEPLRAELEAAGVPCMLVERRLIAGAARVVATALHVQKTSVDLTVVEAGEFGSSVPQSSAVTLTREPRPFVLEGDYVLQGKNRFGPKTTRVPFAHIYSRGPDTPIEINAEHLEDYSVSGESRRPGFKELVRVLCQTLGAATDDSLRANAARLTGASFPGALQCSVRVQGKTALNGSEAAALSRILYVNWLRGAQDPRGEVSM